MSAWPRRLKRVVPAKATPEHDHQVALFRWAAIHEKVRPELKMLFAVPNGGHRHKAVAGKLKAEGVKAGVEDVFLDVARGGYHGLRIEMKAGKNKPTLEQKDWMARHNAEGYLAIICYGWEEAKKVIERYLDLKSQERTPESF